MNERKIPQLGNTVIDITSGLKGIAWQYIEMISGTVQLSIQPRLPDDAPVASPTEPIPPGLSVDIALLDYINDGAVDRVTPAKPEVIALGNEVEDLTTGIRGIAVKRVTFINGCVYYNIIHKMTEKQKEEGSSALEQFISSTLLKVVGNGIAPQVAKNSEGPAERRPGGPSAKVMRA